jgi:hypothetical protein
LNAGITAYIDNYDCYSVFTAPADKLVRFTTIVQNTEANYDFIWLYNAATKNSQILYFSGPTITAPGVWTTTGNSMTIQFHSDGSNTGVGVVARIDFVNKPTISIASSLSASPRSSLSSRGSLSPSVSSRKSVIESSSASISMSGLASASPPNFIYQCSNGVFQTGTGGTITCPHNYIIASVVALGGGPNGLFGTCGSYSLVACGPSLYDFTDPTNVICAGKSSCTFPANIQVYPDYCIGYQKYWHVTAQCVPIPISLSATYSMTTTHTYTAAPSSTAYISLSGSASGSHSSYVSSRSTPSDIISFSTRASMRQTQSLLGTSSSSISSKESLLTSRSIQTSPSSAPTPRAKGPPPPLPNDLTKISLDNLNFMFNDMASYDPALLHGSLHKLGMAAMQQSGGEFGVSTDTFNLKVKALDPAAPAALNIGGTAASLPPLSSLGLASGSAASMIQWTTNPYASQSSLQTDTPTLSLSVIDSTGSEVSVSNLSTPISFSWSLNTSDPRFQPPPVYLVRCDKNELYVQKSGIYQRSTGAIQSVYGSWSVPCLLDVWRPLNCTDFSDGSVKMLECPKPIYTPNCLYWSTNTSSWSSDGCTPTVTNGTMNCKCTHLTDFSSRITAIGEANTAVFANAANVYSLSGLTVYAEWFGIFGGIAAFTLLLGMLALRIDNVTNKKYVKQLCRDTVINQVFDNAPNSAIYIYDKDSNKKCKKIIKQSKQIKEEVKINLFHRICLQHTRLQFLFRYDPRLARIFRLLAIFTVQYHALFVTAFLYGFTYGGDGKSPMAWYDIIALSLITSLLNIPVIKLIMTSLNTIGLKEYEFKFPLLCEEYRRRVEFEKLALIYKKKCGAIKENDDSDELMKLDELEGGDEDSCMNLFFIYFCCRSSNRVQANSLNNLSKKELLVKMIKLLKEKYPAIQLRNSFWSNLPCHTPEAWLFLFCATGWLVWCLNFLLLFAASHKKDVGENIMISYATSEITTVFISQPLTILFSYLFFKGIHKYDKYIPKSLHKYILIITKYNLPHLYYFSNPWVNTAQSIFTSKFAYSLFVRCPAIASNTNELNYAPIKAVIFEKQEDSKCEIEELYNNIMDMKHQLHLREQEEFR